MKIRTLVRLRGFRQALSLLFLCVLSSTLSSAEVVISEIMANNTKTLADEDGAFVDWIELQNRSSNTVSLLNWSLTDSSSNPTRWRLPATNLASGEFLLIFASGKNRRAAGLPLHTNFKLSSSGDYLALVKADGKTIATEFSPQFPPQLADVSYGFGSDSTNVSLVTSNAPIRFLIPTAANGGNSLGESWNGSAEPFPDTSWSRGIPGLGFSLVPTNLVGGTSLVTRLNFDLPQANGLVLDSKPTGALRNATNNGAVWVEAEADSGVESRNRDGVLRFNATEGDQLVLSPSSDLNLTRGSITLWVKTAGNQGPGSSAAILFDRRSSKGDLLALTDDGHLQVQATSAAGVVRNSFTSSRTINDDLWHLVVYSFDNSASGFTSLSIDGVLDHSEASNGAWTWDTLRPLEIGRSRDPFWRRFDGALDDFRIYKRLLTDAEILQIYTGDGAPRLQGVVTDVSAAMQGVNASLLARIPFEVADPASLSLLSLSLRYDDGFVAYLNGLEVARDNAPDFPEWNAHALAPHDSSRADVFDFGDLGRLLKPGTNILAIQALNLQSTDSDFFLAPQLTGFSRGSQNPQPRYFLQATPGRPNIGGAQDLGPIVSEATHQPRVPSDADDLLVTASVSPSFRPVQGVVLNYRVQFGATNQVPMLDDGQHGDGLAGDGLFGAWIPALASTNGQMIRYFITATDDAGHNARWPLFEDPLGSEEYLGTVVTNPDLFTKLPVYQLFVKTPANMDSDTGTRGSFFFNGDFYDNILIRLKGGTTRGLNKKAHRVDFNRDHPFVFDPNQKPTRELALNAEFIDPSYLRQNTSFWLFNQAGTPAPIHFPVRLQLNGQFHELAFHTETMDNALIARMGLNPEGALYKNALMLNIVPESAIGNRDCLEAEKQTRLNENFSDLVAWTSGIAETNSIERRRLHLFDTTDIPSVINYLACFHLTQQADGVHANVCPHRDSGVTDEWRLIPWDMNLSMGQVWATDHVSGSEDSAESHPFYGASGWRDSNISWSYNRLFDSLIVVPEFREMYLRRLRTLMEVWLMPPGTPANQLKMETRIQQMRELIEPEALLDRKKWTWPEGYSGYAMTNVPFGQAVDELLRNYVGQRRTHLFAVHNAANTNYNNRAGIPDSQPVFVPIRFGAMEVTPSSGNHLEEYVELRNTNSIAVDLSGWRLSGAVDFVFKPGTVMPSGSSLFVSPDVRAFRARPTGPGGKQGRFVQGPYQGRLSARGESLTLIDQCNQTVDAFSWAPQPTLAQRFLRITEIMFHPPSASSGGFGPEEFEFLELKNIGTTELDLAGVRLTTGVAFDFASSGITRLGAGQSLVIVKNLTAFQSRYGNGVSVAGTYSGSLSNEGDTLRLEDGAGEIIVELAYDPRWYPTTDGLGFSLVAADESAAPDQWSNPAAWRPSSQSLGSPGSTNPASTLASVRINEILANPVTGQGDVIELFNPSASPVDVGGWFLSDELARPNKYRISQPTLLPAGGYVLLREAQFNSPLFGTNAFALSASGDELHLFSADSAGKLTGYSDSVRFAASEQNVTWGRWTNSVGRVDFVPQQQSTLGAGNSGPRLGSVVISEVFYHGDGVQEEYLEWQNRSGVTVPLFDPLHSTNRWRLRGDVDLDLSAEIFLNPGESMLVVGFDPLLELARADLFRAARQIPSNVRIVGPYLGRFQHSGGTLRLERPGLPILDPKLGASVVPWISVDQVEYRDQAPWPTLADGYGAALSRLRPETYGTDPAAWIAAAPSPGVPSGSAMPPKILVQPKSFASVAGNGSAVLSVTAQSSEALSFQWLFNGRMIPGAIGAELNFGELLLAQSGCYEVVVMNSGGAVKSEVALVNVKLGPLLTLQPTNRLVVVGTNLTLRAAAIGTGPLRYQWLFNDATLVGATNPILNLTNIQALQSGTYRMRVSDDLGLGFSDGANVTAAVRAGILLPPQSISVVAGETAVFSVSANGTLPITFRWRKGAATLTTVTLNESNAFLVLPNVQTAQAGNYSVSLVNMLGASAGTPSFVLSVLPDSDGDRIPDVWETSHGLNPGLADAALDSDGDGVSNLDEYLADTDPRDAGSQLALGLRMENALPVLEFVARSNRTYTVQFTEGLELPVWRRLADTVARGTNRLERVQDSNSADRPRYYRLLTPWQP